MNQVTDALEAWRVLRLGTREVVDGIVSPAHRGPSTELAAALAHWPGAHYWLDPDHSHLVLIRRVGPASRERWLLHAALLLLTVVCSLGAGAALSGHWYPVSEPGLLGLAASGWHFFADLADGRWRDLLAGWSFAIPLLTILLVHELGHYFAARRYAIDASPPYFLPIPPTLSPIGSLGAFLRLRTPVIDRRQLLDVGAAGPLAGFVVALGVLWWGYSVSDPVSYAVPLGGSFVTFAGHPIYLGESILTDALVRYFAPDALALKLSLPAFAGWVGAFITGLNLLPLSQLDGGHVLYGLLGRRQAAVGFVALVALVWLAQYSWSWYVWVAVVLLIGGGRWTHPSVVSPARPVPRGRRWIGWLCVVVFVVTFVPVPFR